MRQRGFTMIELVTTMIVVGILAIAVLPRMDLLRGFDAVGYRDRVRATLEYARKSAVAQRRNVRVTLANGTVTVTIDNDVPEGAQAGTFPRALPLPGINANNFAPPAGITATNATLNFDPLGRSAGAVLTVTDAGNITVHAETGYVQ